jgi:hypothetical protein
METTEREAVLLRVGDPGAEVVMACAVCGEGQAPGDDGVICGHPPGGRADGKPIKRRWVCQPCLVALFRMCLDAARQVADAITGGHDGRV